MSTEVVNLVPLYQLSRLSYKHGVLVVVTTVVGIQGSLLNQWVPSVVSIDDPKRGPTMLLPLVSCRGQESEGFK